MIEGKEIWVLILAPSFWAKISLLGASSLPELSNLRFTVAINFVTLSEHGNERCSALENISSEHFFGCRLCTHCFAQMTLLPSGQKSKSPRDTSGLEWGKDTGFPDHGNLKHAYFSF